LDHFFERQKPKGKEEKNSFLERLLAFKKTFDSFAYKGANDYLGHAFGRKAALLKY